MKRAFICANIESTRDLIGKWARQILPTERVQRAPRDVNVKEQHGRRCRLTTHRFDPVVPAELELVPVDEAVHVLVEHAEHLLHLTWLCHIDVSLVVAEQRATD